MFPLSVRHDVIKQFSLLYINKLVGLQQAPCAAVLVSGYQENFLIFYFNLLFAKTITMHLTGIKAHSQNV